MANATIVGEQMQSCPPAMYGCTYISCGKMAKSQRQANRVIIQIAKYGCFAYQLEWYIRIQMINKYMYVCGTVISYTFAFISTTIASVLWSAIEVFHWNMKPVLIRWTSIIVFVSEHGGGATWLLCINTSVDITVE